MCLWSFLKGKWRTIQTAARYLLVLVLIGLGLWVADYFVVHFSGPTFRDAAMGNLFATLAGVLIGVPVALEINRRLQVEEEKRKKRAALARDRALVDNTVKR